jgi:hypothetical protein
MINYYFGQQWHKQGKKKNNVEKIAAKDRAEENEQALYK